METTVMEEQSPLAERLASMDDKSKLQKFASDEYGVTLDKTLSLPKMTKLILEFHAKIQDVAKEKNEQAAREVTTDDDPLVSFVFKFIEQPGQSVEFSFDHGRGSKFSKRYTLYDGTSQKLPLSVYNHLRSKVVPNDTYDLDPTTGMVKGVNRAVVNRFACEIDIKAMSPEEMLNVQEVLKSQP